MREVVQFICILNLMLVVGCVLVCVGLSTGIEAIPPWLMYVLLTPFLTTFGSLFLAVIPAVRNHSPTLLLVVLTMPPVSLLMLPMLFIKPDPPSPPHSPSGKPEAGTASSNQSQEKPENVRNRDQA